MIRREPFADQQDDFADEDLAPTLADVARAFASHVLVLNEERTANYRVAATRAFDQARERFRREDGELPARGEDALFDRMLTIVDELESSPEALRAACEEVLRGR
jgi:hypothetical protein